jgi:hypothetical protein
MESASSRSRPQLRKRSSVRTVSASSRTATGTAGGMLASTSRPRTDARLSALTLVSVASTWFAASSYGQSATAQQIPAAPCAALEDVGHWPPLESPERVTAAVLGG